MTKPKIDDRSKDRIVWLTKWIDERNKDANYSIEQFDKLTIALSSGGLIFSVGFVKDIIKLSSKSHTWILMISWYSFAASLLVVLFSQIVSYHAHSFELKLSEDEKWQLEETYSYDDSKPYIKIYQKKKKMYNSLTKKLNIISPVALILGILTFIIFINLNI